jgi:hypothetical protein
LFCCKWVVFNHAGWIGATLSWYRVPIFLVGWSAVCLWYSCKS